MVELKLLLILALCCLLLACSGNSADDPVPDGDLEFAEDLEDSEDTEEEIERERPENPPEAKYPKALWRDEVQTGHTFTWGFLPRDYFPVIRDEERIFPIVWDNDNRRILAIDRGEYDDTGANAFYIYSLSEEKSEVLAIIDFPPLEIEGCVWQRTPPDAWDALFVDGQLLWSFYKNTTYLENPDHGVSGVLSYDPETGKTRYLYKALKGWSDVDYPGAMAKVDSNTIIIRRNTGWYLFDLQTETMNPIEVDCKQGQDYSNTCVMLTNDSHRKLDSFTIPSNDSPGFSLFRQRLMVLENRGSGGWDITALADLNDEPCKFWWDYEECLSEWMSFGSDCCIKTRNIFGYKDDTYILSGLYSALFKVDLDRGGLQRMGEKVSHYSVVEISPDGTPAEEALMGGVQNWLITDDGDLMWVSPYDYSIRGIAGPLDEWAE